MPQTYRFLTHTNLMAFVMLFGGAAAFGAVLGQPAEPDADPVAVKLKAAKSAYAEQSEKHRKTVLVWFDKRETELRRSGDKKAIDRLAADRKRFDQNRPVRELPTELKRRFGAARRAMDEVYTKAVTEYVRKKNDAAAAVVQKELDEFRKQVTDPYLPVKDEFFRLKNRNSDLFVAVSRGSTSDGSEVIHWTPTGSKEQDWQLVPVDQDWYHIRNRNSGTLLTVSPSTNAMEIRKPATTGDGYHQHWQFIVAKGQDENWFYIKNRKTDEYLTVEKGSKNRGARIVHSALLNPKVTAIQQWSFDIVE